MVITDEQVAKHHLFYPKSPLILVTNENMPETIEEVENLFMKYPIYPQKSKEEEAQNVADLLNAVDESTTEKESKPAKKTAKKKKHENRCKYQIHQHPDRCRLVFGRGGTPLCAGSGGSEYV